MSPDSYDIRPIGVVHSPFKEAHGTPIQPIASDAKGTVEVFSEFREGLEDLEGFSHIFLLTYLHNTSGYSLKVFPFLDTTPRGLFSTRAPRRPNPIGLSIVDLESVEHGVLHVSSLDLLDKTPVLDIKPYVSRFDLRENVRDGWLESSSLSPHCTRDDGRFCGQK